MGCSCPECPSRIWGRGAALQGRGRLPASTCPPEGTMSPALSPNSPALGRCSGHRRLTWSLRPGRSRVWGNGLFVWTGLGCGRWGSTSPQSTVSSSSETSGGWNGVPSLSALPPAPSWALSPVGWGSGQGFGELPAARLVSTEAVMGTRTLGLGIWVRAPRGLSCTEGKP